MLKTRIIPVLTYSGFGLVKTKRFSNPRMVGNPVQSARVYNSRRVDELIFLDIAATQQKRKINLKLVKDVIAECMMPTGIGGGISELKDIQDLLKVGADKVVIKTMVLKDPRFIEEAAKHFGRQCLTVAVDAVRNGDTYEIFNNLGKKISLQDFIKTCNDYGAGELIITGVDNDGMMAGFDISLIKYAERLSELPIVACGGAGSPTDFLSLFKQSSIEACACASIFHFTQYTPLDIKQLLEKNDIPVRI